MTTADGVGLRFGLRPGAGRGVVLLFQGRTEFLEKYHDAADEIVGRGFTLATVDWRGQGASDRLLPNRRKGHVADFAAYQHDAAALLAATADLPGPRVVLAHSMGGAIALRALTTGALAGAPPAAAYFSAPMWGLGIGRVASVLARVAAGAAVRLGFGDRYAPGGGDASYAETNPAKNVLTADPAMAAWIAATTRANDDKALGGPTFGWIHAGLSETAALDPLRLTVPAAVTAGSDEQVVSLPAIKARAARDGLALRVLPGGRHESMFEAPERRAAFWAGFDALLAQQGV